MGAIDYIKALNWYLGDDIKVSLGSPLSGCNFSSIDPDFSPVDLTPCDLNATFRRKLSFGEDDPFYFHAPQNVFSNPSKVFDPDKVMKEENWRFNEDSQDTIVPDSRNEFDEKGNISDMSFIDNSEVVGSDDGCSQFLKGSDANWGFQHNTQTMNTEIYSSLQQMCLSMDSNDSFAKPMFDFSEGEEPTDEDIYQYYVNQFPALSSILVTDYCSSDDSPKSAQKRTRKKPKTKKKVKAKRKCARRSYNWSAKMSPSSTDSNEPTEQNHMHVYNEDSTQVAEVDSTTISPENHYQEKPKKKPKSKCFHVYLVKENVRSIERQSFRDWLY